MASSRDGASGSLALAFATIERPQVAQRLIASARRRFPMMPIYVADQSLDVQAMASFYAHMGVTLIRMPYDAGVCASRNCLVAAIAEQYFVLCDDDFVFGARTEFSEALRILRYYPEIGVVGGKLYDYEGSEEYTRHWELFLHLDPVNRILTSTPIFNYAPRAIEMGTTRFYQCDAVMNFSVMRRKIFEQPLIRWDERFKSNGEHEDFFLNLKLNSSVRVTYLPTMVAYHHHPEAFERYRSKLRNRVEGWQRLFEKWNIDQHLEVGLGVRSIDDLSATFETEQAQARFFLNDNLSLRRERNNESLLVGLGASLSSVGLLTEAGEPNGSSATMGRVLVRATSGGVMSGPDSADATHQGRRLDPDADESPQSRYSLTPTGPVIDLGRVGMAAQFRYNCIARSNADFILWYRFTPLAGPEGTPSRNAPGTVSLHLRWFADDGRVLMWESSEYLLDIRRSDYWVPLLVEVPVCPGSCAYMRFEVVGVEAGARLPVGIGFLMNQCSNDTAIERPTPVQDVLAFAPWAVPYNGAAPPASRLNRLSCPISNYELTAHVSKEVPDLMMLSLGDESAVSDGSEVSTLFVFGWHGLGAPLLVIPHPDGARLDARTSDPLRVALPRQAAQSLQVVAFTKDQGYRHVALRHGSETGAEQTAQPSVSSVS
jgi:hypothetical protein